MKFPKTPGLTALSLMSDDKQSSRRSHMTSLAWAMIDRWALKTKTRSADRIGEVEHFKSGDEDNLPVEDLSLAVPLYANRCSLAAHFLHLHIAIPESLAQACVPAAPRSTGSKTVGKDGLHTAIVGGMYGHSGKRRQPHSSINNCQVDKLYGVSLFGADPNDRFVPVSRRRLGMHVEPLLVRKSCHIANPAIGDEGVLKELTFLPQL